MRRTEILVRILRGNFRGHQAKIITEGPCGATLRLQYFILNIPTDWYVRERAA